MSQLPKKIESKSKGSSYNKDIEAFISTPRKTPKKAGGKGQMSSTKRTGSIKLSNSSTKNNENY